MKKYTLPLFALFLFAFSCKKDADKSPTPAKVLCKPTTENYVTGEIANQPVCREASAPFTFTYGGISTCESQPGSGNLSYKYLGVALWVSENYGANEVRRLSIEIPFECEAFSTKEKFFNAFTLGKYGFLPEKEGYGKFIITYKEPTGQYSTLHTNQDRSSVEILEIQKINSPGPGSGMGQNLKIKMKINCFLTAQNGTNVITFKDVIVTGYVSRLTKGRERYPDWEE